jgi:ribosome-binding protein aMBF1 (putative translation factor)
MTPEQCRAARAWLGWTQVELAKKSKIGLSTLMDFESQYRATQATKQRAIQAALEKRGIRFLNSGILGIAFVKRSRKKRN